MIADATYEAVPRAAMRNSLLRSPLLRSMTGFGMGGALAIAPSLLSIGETETLIVYGLAIAALVAAILVLAQSAAIRRIGYLSHSSKQLRDELARSNLYADQIRHALSEVSAFRRQRSGGDPMQMLERVLEAAFTRASAYDPSVRLYAVETTPQRHVVRARAGGDRFGIDVGKSCPSDRSLSEIVTELSLSGWIAPLSIRGVKCSLVMLTEQKPLSQADCAFVDQMAMILSLADDRFGQTKRPRSKSGAKLRAV